jgi:ABC-type oligopeptide transport system ATPase subunit
VSGPLLQVQDLVKDFPVGRGRRRSVHRAVDHVSFDVAEGEVLGLVGESGSGKSTTARCILRLVEPTSGQVRFDGTDVLTAGGPTMKKLRREMQMVFQDPYSSLNPRMSIEDIVTEGMVIHRTHKSSAARRARAEELMGLVGLSPEHLRRRPAQFSGGQRQRIGIARAIALEPRLLICDEPVASLDVSIQAQILNLFKDLQQRFSLTIVYIAHDLATVRFLCDRIAVMRDGVIEEIGSQTDIYERPRSPYTRELLQSVPIPDPAVEQRRYSASRTTSGAAAEKPEMDSMGLSAAELDSSGPTAPTSEALT